MSLFATLMGKIFGHANPPAATTPVASAPAAAAAPVAVTTPAATAPVVAEPAAATAAAQPAAAPVVAQPVDVEAVLNELAAKNPEKLDWKKSIVDLMKLVGMDSSLANRKELAKELGYTADESDSAAMNVWLHKQVLQKLADNGGKVPADLLK